MAFRGIYHHTVDDKGRVALPARYRHEFAEGSVLALQPEGCVEVYPTKTYDLVSEDYAREPITHLSGRRMRRGFFPNSADAELDRQGRILLPADYRQDAQLNGAVVIIGNRECLEIWSPDRWEQESRQVAAAHDEELKPVE